MRRSSAAMQRHGDEMRTQREVQRTQQHDCANREDIGGTGGG